MKKKKNMWQRVGARIGESAIERLAKATVAVAGLGSLGSQIVVPLAMTGVGNFVLFDPDILEAHNVPRHAAGLRFVGRSKVDVMKEMILDRNPQAKVLAVASDMRLEKSDVLRDVDLLIIAGLGSEIAQFEIASLARQAQTPILVGGVYTRGTGGEVFFVDPKQGPCYMCFAMILRDVEKPKAGQGNFNYGLPPDEVRAEPGLGIHVGRVALLAADWAMRFLINDPKVLKPYSHNLAVIANEEMEIGESKGKPVILPPGGVYWMTIGQQKGCSVCDTQLTGQSLDDL